MEVDSYVFFQGAYDNQWQCTLPKNYLGESILTPTILTTNSVLLTPLENKAAVLAFIQLFPECTFEQQQAFMKIGFPLLQLVHLQK